MAVALLLSEILREVCNGSPQAQHLLVFGVYAG